MLAKKITVIVVVFEKYFIKSKFYFYRLVFILELQNSMKNEFNKKARSWKEEFYNERIIVNPKKFIM